MKLIQIVFNCITITLIVVLIVVISWMKDDQKNLNEQILKFEEAKKEDERTFKKIITLDEFDLNLLKEIAFLKSQVTALKLNQNTDIHGQLAGGFNNAKQN